jgi:hypothetical protein
VTQVEITTDEIRQLALEEPVLSSRGVVVASRVQTLAPVSSAVVSTVQA